MPTFITMAMLYILYDKNIYTTKKHIFISNKYFGWFCFISDFAILSPVDKVLYEKFKFRTEINN